MTNFEQSFWDIYSRKNIISNRLASQRIRIVIKEIQPIDTPHLFSDVVKRIEFKNGNLECGSIESNQKSGILLPLLYLLAIKRKYDGNSNNQGAVSFHLFQRFFQTIGRIKKRFNIYESLKSLRKDIKNAKGHTLKYQYIRSVLDSFFGKIKTAEGLNLFFCSIGNLKDTSDTSDQFWAISLPYENIEIVLEGQYARQNELVKNELMQILTGEFFSDETARFLKAIDMPKETEKDPLTKEVKKIVHDELQKSNILITKNRVANKQVYDVTNFLVNSGLDMVFNNVSKDLRDSKHRKITPDPDYYIGTNAQWRHIIAGQDVIREDLISEIWSKLQKKNICIIKSESGQGKTTLMYRFAFSVQKQFNILQLTYLNRELARLCGFKLPVLSLKKKSLVLIDNITQYPDWYFFLEQLAQKENIYLLATVREDKWNISKIYNIESLIEYVKPKLDLKTAKRIFKNLASQKLINDDGYDWKSIYAQSNEGLLEYVAFLTQHTHLKNVVKNQVLCLAENRNALNVLRIISTMHTYGYGTTFEFLRQCTKLPTLDVAFTIRKLKGHIVKKNKSYEGMHELRSKYAMEAIHEDFPLEETVLEILDNLSMQDCGNFLYGILDSYPDIAYEIAEKFFHVLPQINNVAMIPLILGTLPQDFFEKNSQIMNTFAHTIANVISSRKSLSILIDFSFESSWASIYSKHPRCNADAYYPLYVFLTTVNDLINYDEILSHWEDETIETLNTFLSTSSCKALNPLQNKLISQIDSSKIAKMIITNFSSSEKNESCNIFLNNLSGLFENLYYLNPSMLYDVVTYKIPKDQLIKIISSANDFFDITDFLCVRLKEINFELSKDLFNYFAKHIELSACKIEEQIDNEYIYNELDPRKESRLFGEFSQHFASKLYTIFVNIKKTYKKCPQCNEITEIAIKHICKSKID